MSYVFLMLAMVPGLSPDYKDWCMLRSAWCMSVDLRDCCCPLVVDTMDCTLAKLERRQAHSNQDISGTYEWYMPVHFGTVLTIRGATYELKKPRTDPEYGTVVQRGNVFCLRTREGRKSVISELFRVVWGERSYLIEPTRMLEFCNEVNAGSEPRSAVRGHFLLRADDWKKAVEGGPLVPAEYNEYYLLKAVECRVLEVKAYKKSVRIRGAGDAFNGYVVNVDKGKINGLRSGMKCYSKEAPEQRTIGYVIDADETEASLLIIAGTDGSERPDVGLLLSTRRSQDELDALKD